MKAVTVELVDFTLQSIGTATTDNTHTLVQNDAGKKIAVTVSYTDGGGATESVTSAATPEVVIPPTLYPPLPKTLVREELANSNFRLLGIIVADGGSPVTGVAVEVADNMLFRNANQLDAELLPNSPNFSATVTLEPGKRYYYRAVATNAMGTAYGSPKKFTTPPDQSHWWSDSSPQAGGWRTSSWFGTFRPYDNGWIYHAKLGWAYAHPDGSDGLWLWVEGHKWMWTQQGVFPYLWKHDVATWGYLIGLRNGIPKFFDWRGKKTTEPVDCCTGMEQSVNLVDGQQSPEINKISARGNASGKLCWKSTTGSTPPVYYKASLYTADFSQGGMVITVTGNLSDDLFRFQRKDGVCFETRLADPAVISVFTEVKHSTGQTVQAQQTIQTDRQDCCTGMEQSVNLVDGQQSPEINKISARGNASGKLCWESTRGSLPNPIHYKVSFYTNDFSQGGMVISTSGFFSNNLFRFERKDGVCFEARLGSPDRVNVFREIHRK
jgi:hypothetical protein